VGEVDLGEIHPAALTNGKAAMVISARRLRAAHQYTARRLAALQAKQARYTQGSRRWKRLQRRKHRFLAKQQRTRDAEHKSGRAGGHGARGGGWPSSWWRNTTRGRPVLTADVSTPPVGASTSAPIPCVGMRRTADSGGAVKLLSRQVRGSWPRSCPPPLGATT